MRQEQTKQQSATRSEFRQAGERLDAVLGKPEVPDDVPRTRISQANFVRSPGTRVWWPDAPVSEYRRLNPENY